MALNVALIHPQIHWNAGNAGRTCLAIGATLHLVAPLGFSLDAREVKRAGLDYWPHVDLRTWPSWPAFAEALPTLGTPWLFDEGAVRDYWDAPLAASDDVVLCFGPENGGAPADARRVLADQRVRIPMVPTVVRSLNLSTCVALGTYEVLRQRRQLSVAAPP